MQQIQNGTIQVKAKMAGAELTSIVKDGVEYLWQASENVWGKHSPILFPIVGALMHNTYRIGEKTYQLPKHGFARDMEFELVAQSADTLHYQLKYTEALLLQYPFKFELNVIYTIENDGLKVTYWVNNVDDKAMLFSVGGHPAFNCPIFPDEKFEDYELKFELEEDLFISLVNLADGTIKDEQVLLPRVKNSVAIDTHLFDNDALIFKNLKSTWVSVVHKATGKGVKMTIDEFPALGVWSKTGTNKFVCLEPWQGLADASDFTGQFAEKEGIVVLNPKDSWKRSYVIQLI